MNLNGWQRLWVVVFALWGLAIALWAILLGPEGTGLALPVLGLMWLIPASFAYGLGWSVGWIRRGFRKPEAGR
jgi:hypothetical protein